MLKLISLFSVLLVAGLSCTKPGCLGAAGPQQSQTRSIGEFSQVRLEGNINMVLVQGSANSAELSGPVNILENISTEIIDGKHVIAYETSCRWARNAGEEVTLRLSFRDINLLEYAGSGNVSNLDTLRLPSLKIESYTGAGDIELTVDNGYTGVFVHLENAAVKMHGKSVGCNTYTNSRGLTDMSDFTVQDLVIEYGGLADTHVNVTGTIDAMLFYKGNIYYRGNAAVTRDTHYSTGRLIRQP